MDEHGSEEAPKMSEAAKEAAMDAANDLKVDAEKTIGEIRGRGLKGFFAFDNMYFPIIARYIFIVLVVLGVIGIVIGVIGGFVNLFSTGVFAGLATIFFSIIGGALGLLYLRFTFELMIVGFKINEGIQEIRANTRK